MSINQHLRDGNLSIIRSKGDPKAEPLMKHLKIALIAVLIVATVATVFTSDTLALSAEVAGQALPPAQDAS